MSIMNIAARSNGRFFRTGEVAAIFGVSHRSVAKWADQGLLACFKFPTGGRGAERRFKPEDIRAFALAHGWDDPIAALERLALVPSVLLVGVPDALPLAGQRLDGLLSLGMALADLSPAAHRIILDRHTLSVSEVRQALRACRERLPAAVLIVLLVEDDPLTLGLSEDGANHVLRRPLTAATVEVVL